MRTAQTSAIDHSSVPGLTMPAGSGLARTCGEEMNFVRRNAGPSPAIVTAVPGNPHHTVPLFENRSCGPHDLHDTRRRCSCVDHRGTLGPRKAWGRFCRFCIFWSSFLPRRTGRRTENHFASGAKAGGLTPLTPTCRSQRSCRSCCPNPGRRRHRCLRPNRPRTRSSDGPPWRSHGCRASGRCS